MALSDKPPPHVPAYVVPLATALLALGVLAWDGCYVLCIRAARKRRSSPMPLVALALNLGWEIVYLAAVIETPEERANFSVWLLLDAFIVREILKPETRRRDWGGRRNGAEAGTTATPTTFLERRLGSVLLVMTAAAAAANYAFVRWWLAVPHRGFGPGSSGRWTGFEEMTARQTKAGKWWSGREGFDTTELASWSAIVSQLALSAGSLVQLLSRGHSGGAGYGIWFCRFVGTFLGLYAVPVVFWYHWPEAQAYVVSWPAVSLCVACLLLDIAYPLSLWRVRQSEVVLPDGQLVSAAEAATAATKKTD